MTDQKTYERQLSLLLRRQLELQKDSSLEAVHDLVDAHFAALGNNNLLSSSQLNSLENVAFTSLSTSDVEKFIQNQASKELKASTKKTWVHNELHNQILAQVKQIRDDITTKLINVVKDKARSGLVPQDRMDAWFSRERKQEIQMNLLREFISQFTAVYGFKAAERLSVAGAKEEDD